MERGHQGVAVFCQLEETSQLFHSLIKKKVEGEKIKSSQDTCGLNGIPTEFNCVAW